MDISACEPHIRKVPRGKPKVVNFNRLEPYERSNNNARGPEEAARIAVEKVEPANNRPTFEEYMVAFFGTGIVRFGVTAEIQQDLFKVPTNYSIAH